MRRWVAAGLTLVSWLVGLGCQTTGPAPAASTPPAAFPLAGTTWTADEIEGERPVDPVESTITFEGAARMVGSTGCNRYVAPLTVSGPALRVGEVAMTRRACPPTVMDQERRFVAALGAIRAYRQEEDTLWLLDETGRVRVRLTRNQTSAPVRANPDQARHARASSADDRRARQDESLRADEAAHSDRGDGDGALGVHLREPGGRPQQEIAGSRSRRLARQGGKACWISG